MSASKVKDSSLLMNKFVKACEVGNAEEVRRLLSHVSKPNFPRKDLESQLKSPMYWACKSGSLEVVKLLIEHYPGFDPYYINDTGHNLLSVACTRGHVEVARFLYDKYCLSPTEPNRNGTTPIFSAAYNGHFEMLKCLVYDMNCDPRSLNLKGENLLHVACEKKHLNIIRYLVKEHNLDPRLEDNHKKTPLHSACSSGHLGITKYFIEECGCKTEVFDRAGCTPLHDACRNGHIDVVRCFIERRWCNLNLFDNSGYTPFHLSCRFGRKDVVKMLLMQGNVNPDVRTATDLTPLQITRDQNTTKELIRGGANTAGMMLEVFHEYIKDQPLDPLVHIFAIGHSASGKSTLANALQQSRYSTKPHAMEVIELGSAEFGKVILYDFPGNFEFHPSHAALLKHCKFTSPPLFLLVVNLQNSFEESKRQVHHSYL